MRRYETIFIVDPDLSGEEHAPLFERLKLLFPQMGGFLVSIDEWGLRKLAYEIKKKTRGHYVRLDYCGTGTLVNEIERFFRIDDRVLKYLTVLIEEDVDLESLKEELAKAEIKADRPDQVKESNTEPTAAVTVESETDTTASQTVPVESNKEEL
ncbi:MAG: 30S ribosomal protein S6 [Pseudomonadota bacterium]|uniref:Small ribosomal subunit protein bS6 n=1 Tax=Candidatus Desulfatibia profunda TaxID=2841695 RepID=A0A8J6TK78_9BACT|nr:30S ribosomal protein S6 [Candidatus Desulfatibia profunda]MBL7179167.1 30S ribosomal protein S6 [Desulfobacterales bacterium]